jgi:transaldolase
VTRLHDLYTDQGQSPWLDNLRRDYLHNGHLADLISQGVRGITSNPTIFAKAIAGEDDYDAQFASLLEERDDASPGSIEEIYWDLVLTDIREALEMLEGTHATSNGVDGYVSVEVAPALARDTTATTAAARDLHQRVAKPNLLVKIPATVEGVPAIRTMIGEGRSVNVTLIFSIERYAAVIDAYLGGLEDSVAAGATDLSGVRSVASFFVSRVDTEVDRRLNLIAASGGTRAALPTAQLLGTAGVAQARRAYALFKDRFAGPRWEALAARGAKVQRPLWASTSTKNPAYPDLLYVDSLIGPDTINTMPDETLAAFMDHGNVSRTVDVDPDADRASLERLAEAGIDIEDVASTLEAEGVASFAKSFDDLMDVLAGKARSFQGSGADTKSGAASSREPQS